MSKGNLDKDTQRVVAEGGALDAMFGSSGWEIAEKSLQETVAALRDVGSIDLTRDDVTLQLQINKGIAESLDFWLNDLKGRVNNVTMMSSPKEGSTLIDRR